MKAEIITIGTELLLGQIVNTNAAFLSRELTELGIEIYHHTSVGDNPERLTRAVVNAEKRADLLIFSGGLGPTKDDITKEVVANHLSLNLIEEKNSKKHIEDFYRNLDIQMPENNYDQSQIIEGSEILVNENGMAPGVYLEENNHLYAMLPGVPSEMKVMVTNHLVPKLREKIYNNQVLESRVLRFYGITESLLAEKLDKIIEKQTNPTVAIYVDNQELTIRITANAGSLIEAEQFLDEMEDKIQNEVSEFFFGYGEKYLPEVVSDLLIEDNLSISILEGISGGLILNEFTQNLETDTVFKGGYVYSSAQQLTKFLPIKAELIEDNGINSEATAIEGARQMAYFFESDIGIAIMGTAMANNTEKNLPKEFWVGISYAGKTYAKYFDYSKRRNRSRRHFLLSTMDTLRQLLLEKNI